MVKKLIPAVILALAALGLGGAAQAHDDGSTTCTSSGPLGEQGVGIFTGPGTCQDEFQDGHAHCGAFVVVLGLDCA